MSPLVSVIVPNYNHEKYLHQRIDSILNQTFTNFELILLDDCSTDSSYNILLSYQENPKVTTIKQNEQNTRIPFKQWEKGIMMAQGKYIWVAESDDYADTHFLENTVKMMEKYPEASICLTDSYLVDSNGQPIPNEYEREEEEQEKIFESEEYLCQKMFWTNTVYNASMVLFRKEDCLNIAQAYKQMRYCGDWFFWIEQIRKGKVIEIRKKLNYFRQHKSNTTKEGAKNGRSLLDIITIREHCCRILPINWSTKMIYRSGLFHNIKHLPVCKEEKKRLYEHANKEGNINCWTHFLGRLVRIYTKHICRERKLGYKLP